MISGSVLDGRARTSPADAFLGRHHLQIAVLPEGGEREMFGYIAPGTEKFSVTGTVLVRDWQGTEHRVTVREADFEFEGRPYKSLSAIARAITGTRWNGWTFFGLKRVKP